MFIPNLIVKKIYRTIGPKPVNLVQSDVKFC